MQRDRQEIEAESDRVAGSVKQRRILRRADLRLEVLLDMRELLQTMTATFNEEAARNKRQEEMVAAAAHARGLSSGESVWDSADGMDRVTVERTIRELDDALEAARKLR